jgi:hypothetical protein
MTAFSDDDANRILEDFEKTYAASGAVFKPTGGYKLRGKADYDAYVIVGATAAHGASIAIRKPKDRDAYFAIVRKSGRRLISEDQIPFDQLDVATAVFAASLRVAALGKAAKTMIRNADLDAANP